MTLTTYAGRCTEYVQELSQSLSKDDIDGLQSDCAALGGDRWDEWAAANVRIISEYVSSSPSQRAKRKVWQDQILRRRLVLAAVQHLYRARNLLRVLDDYRLAPGCSYREMAALAGNAYLDICSQEVPDWPFPGDNPFGRRPKSNL